MGQSTTDPRSSNPYLAPAPLPADVGIVAALPLELGFFVDRLKKVRKYKASATTVLEGEFEGRIVAVVYAGAGRTAARKATELLVVGHRPNLIISAGFAGGLNPALARSQVVLPSEIVDLDGQRFSVQALDTEPGTTESAPFRLVTIDHIARTASEKAQLRESYQADLVDMETSAVAEVSRDRGVRFLSIRAISDEAAAELPAEIAAMLNRSTSYQVGAAFRAIWNRPAAVKDFWALHSRAMEASDRLAQELAKAINRLGA